MDKEESFLPTILERIERSAILGRQIAGGKARTTASQGRSRTWKNNSSLHAYMYDAPKVLPE